MRWKYLLLCLLLLSGLAWAEPLSLTAEGVTVLSTTTDAFGQNSLLFQYQNEDNYSNELYYTALASFEPNLLFQTGNEVAEPLLVASPWGLVATWQDKGWKYGTVSLDNGQHFGPVRQLMSNKDEFISPTYPPQLLSPTNGLITNAPTIEIVYRQNDQQPTLCKIELSWQRIPIHILLPSSA